MRKATYTHGDRLEQSPKSKTFFIDIRNVLLFFELEKMHSQIAKYCLVSIEEVKNALQKNGWGEKYEQGEIDSRTLFHKLSPEVQGSKGFASWMDTISDVFRPNDSLTPIIKELKQRKIKLFTLSNICEAHFNYAYIHFPILHLFDGHLLSYELKKKKPDPEFYKEALQKACTDKQHCFYVDGIEEYVKIARALGIDSELYTNPSTLRLQLTQRDFLESPEITGTH